MKCIQCGLTLDPEWTECVACGYPVREETGKTPAGSKKPNEGKPVKHLHFDRPAETEITPFGEEFHDVSESDAASEPAESEADAFLDPRASAAAKTSEKTAKPRGRKPKSQTGSKNDNSLKSRGSQKTSPDTALSEKPTLPPAIPSQASRFEIEVDGSSNETVPEPNPVEFQDINLFASQLAPEPIPINKPAPVPAEERNQPSDNTMDSSPNSTPKFTPRRTVLGSTPLKDSADDGKTGEELRQVLNTIFKTGEKTTVAPPKPSVGRPSERAPSVSAEGRPSAAHVPPPIPQKERPHTTTPPRAIPVSNGPAQSGELKPVASIPKEPAWAKESTNETLSAPIRPGSRPPKAELKESPTPPPPSIQPPSDDEDVIQVTVAGFFQRLLASFIDHLFALLLTFFFVTLAIVVFGPDEFNDSSNHAISLAFSLPINHGTVMVGLATMYLAFFAFLFLFFSSTLGRTPGQMILKLQTIRLDGEEISFGSSFIRLIGYAISSIPLFIGFLWIIMDERKQGLHDKLAQTLVICLDPTPDDSTPQPETLSP